MPKIASHLRERWLFILWLLSVGLLIFAYGVAVGVFRIFPYSFLESLAAAGSDLIRHPQHNVRLRPEKFLMPARHEGEGVVRHFPEKAHPGVTFLDGLFGEHLGMRLVAMDGETIHEWRVSFNEIWSDAPHLDRKPHDWDTQIHGAHLYPNGDVVFNFQYAGLVRIDKCSQVRWTLPHQVHHSVFEDTNGDLWVPGRRLRQAPVEQFPRVPAPFQEEYILKVSADGRVLEEISILEAIFESQYEGVLFATGAHEARIDVPLDGDFTHLNDIAVLSPQLAPAFPMFAAGDVLISLRNLNLLMVLSPDGRQVKWSMTGPYIRQHDPDFLPNGRISVFDNRRDGDDGMTFGGSRILSVDPLTQEVISLYGERDGEWFYTEVMGDHQHLPNGNILITESEAGHAFEVADGEIVWSYVNRWDADTVAMIGRAIRYPEQYRAAIEQARCRA